MIDVVYPLLFLQKNLASCEEYLDGVGFSFFFDIFDRDRCQNEPFIGLGARGNFSLQLPDRCGKMSSKSVYAPTYDTEEGDVGERRA